MRGVSFVILEVEVLLDLRKGHGRVGVESFLVALSAIHVMSNDRIGLCEEVVHSFSIELNGRLLLVLFDESDPETFELSHHSLSFSADDFGECIVDIAFSGSKGGEQSADSFHEHFCG